MTAHHSPSLNDEESRLEAQRYAGLALAISSVMAAFKIVVGLLSASHALLASALYSINDILSSIAISVSLRLGRRPPDHKHPYGYGKAEFIAVAMVSLAIAMGVFFMFFFSVIDILKGVPGPPHFLAMSLAAISLVVAWMMSKKAHHLADKLKSPAISTSAAHNHADAEGSLLALIGIGGAILGFHVLDRVIAVIETLHLIGLSGVLLSKAVKGLMDAAIPEEDIDLVEQACRGVDRVVSVNQIRSRRTGCETWLDIAITVPKGLRAVECHEVREKIKDAVVGVLGGTVRAQICFQGPDLRASLPGAGGGVHA